MSRLPAQAALWVLIVGKAVLEYLRGSWRVADFRTQGIRVHISVRWKQSGNVDLQIGSGVSIGAGSVVVLTDEGSPGCLSTLIVGRNTGINEYCNIRASGGSIRIGEKCMIAQFVNIVASNHSMGLGAPMIDQPWSAEKNSILIGDDVWIGAGATILPGVNIGSGAVIAAGAVISRHVPENEVWGGVPGRFLKKRT